MYSGLDTYLFEASQQDIFDTAVRLRLFDATSNRSRILLKFPLRKVPHNFTLTNARIGLYLDRAVNVNSTLAIHRVSADWDQWASWLKRKLNDTWTTAGGDFDATALATTAITTLSTGFVYFGDGDAEFLDLVNDWLDESVDNFGVLIKHSTEVNSGLDIGFYAMNDRGLSYDEQDSAVAEIDRTTAYHPVLELTGTYSNTSLVNLVKRDTLAVEKRARKYKLERPVIDLPVTLSQGVPFLKNETDVSEIVQDWSYTRARTQPGTTVSIDAHDEEDGKYREFFQPMDIVQLEERVVADTGSTRWQTQIFGVVDGDQWEVSGDIPDLPLECRDPSIYGLINTYEGRLRAVKISYSEVTLTGTLDVNGFYVFQHQLATLERTYNWVPDPKPSIFIEVGGKKKFYDESDQLKIFHGQGRVVIEQSFFEAARDKGGMGNPGTVKITYQRFSTPLDDFFDSMPVNYAIFKVLQDAGYQHVEDSGWLYVKQLKPVLADFVFDRVYNVVSGVATDVTDDVQAESGSTLESNMTFGQNTGDAVYFKLNRDNHRFNWIFWVGFQHVDTDGIFVFEFWNGSAWTAVTPLGPDIFLRGGSDTGAATFQRDGLITFDEGDLATWTAKNIVSDIPAATDTTLGFWMRVRCTTVPTVKPIAHRWAGKETLVLGQDTASCTFRDFDDRKHFDVVEEMVQKWGVPNYYVEVDRHGDVVGRYIVQNSSPDYTLGSLERVRRLRDSKRIYTRVVVKVQEFNNENVKNYALKTEGGVASHTNFVFQDVDGNNYNSTDFFIGQFQNEATQATEQLDNPIDTARATYWGLRYKAGSGRKRIDPAEWQDQVVYTVTFVTTIKLMGLKFRGAKCKMTVEGFFPESSSWVALPRCTAIQLGGGDKLLKFDFTTDPDPDRPLVNAIRFRVVAPRRKGGTRNAASTIDLSLNSVEALGVASGEVIQGEATFGVTSPFNTASDLAFLTRYHERTFPVDKNPFVTSVAEADRFALNLLRELVRLYDPLEVEGVYPFIEIGDTVRVQQSILGVNSDYVVEEYDRRPGMEFNARIVPYRDSLSMGEAPVIEEPPSETPADWFLRYEFESTPGFLVNSGDGGTTYNLSEEEQCIS